MDNIQTESQLLKRKKIIRRTAAAFVCVIILLTFFSSTINNFLLPTVECDTASSGTLTNEITAEGEIFPVGTEAVYAYGIWKVRDVKVEEEQEVASGEELAVIDSRDLQLDIKKAELNVQKLENELKRYKNGFQEADLEQYRNDCEAALKAVQKARKNLDDQKELYAVDAVSLQEVNDAQDKLDAANREYNEKQRTLSQKETEIKKAGESYGINIAEKESELEVGKLELQKMKNNIPMDGIIKAPVGGTIKSISIEKGSVTGSGQVLFEIVKKESGLAVRWTLETKPAGEVEINDTVEISGEADENFNFNGKVKDKKYLTEQGKYQFTSYLENSKEDLKIGQKVDVKVRRESRQYKTLVPNSSIVDEGGRKYVFLLKERKGVLGTETYVQKVEITVQEEADLYSAVSLNGFAGDEKIVVFSSKALSDGLQVKLR